MMKQRRHIRDKKMNKQRTGNIFLFAHHVKVYMLVDICI